MVRLRPNRHGSKQSRRPVSIPLWCDCDGSRPNVPGRTIGVSIPLWCDCDYYIAPKEYAIFNVSIPLWCDCDFAIASHPALPAEFQSHYGAITTLGNPLLEGTRKDFNPTMVRLRPRKIIPGTLPGGLFQSHYGAIATGNKKIVLTLPVKFQSHYGAIAT